MKLKEQTEQNPKIDAGDNSVLRCFSISAAI